MNIDVKPRISWSEKAEEMLTGCAMCRLFRGVIPYIRIRNFATAEECENLVQSAVKEGFSSYRGVEPVINRIGNTVFEYNSISKPFREKQKPHKSSKPDFCKLIQSAQPFCFAFAEAHGKKRWDR